MDSIRHKKRLIVNADDLGYSTEINEGILEAHRNGIVTSASLLTNMPGFTHAVMLLKETPSLEAGVHLNVYRGTPLTSCPHLTKRGEFLCSPSAFLIRSYAHRHQVRAEVRAEFEAQIRRALDAGIQIAHLDTEKHLHTIPLVFEIVLSLAIKYHIPSVRLPYELPTVKTLLNPGQFLKLLVMTLFAPWNRRLLTQSGRTAPDRLIGVSLSRRFTVSALTSVIENLPPGTTELSCHPGYVRGSAGTYIDAYREEELRTLTDPRLRARTAELAVVLSTFSDIR